MGRVFARKGDGHGDRLPDPSQTNFVLARFGSEAEADGADKALGDAGLIVRAVKSYGLAECLRITVGKGADCKRVVQVLARIQRRLGRVTQVYEKVALIGLGLIAGSMGLAMKRAGLAGTIVGHAHTAKSRETALELGLVDAVFETAARGSRQMRIWWFCVCQSV